MRIKWYGTAALIIDTGDAVLSFDPFDGIPLGASHPEHGPLPHVDEFRKAKHVFVTHGHFDHIVHIPALFGGAESAIHATETPARTLIKRGVPEDHVERVTPGDSILIGSTSVRAFRSRHCRFDLPLLIRTAFGKRTLKNIGHFNRLLRLNSRYPENGETVCYEVESGGKRIMILGSLGLHPKTGYPAGADLLILPFQGKRDPTEAALSIVGRLMPKRVVLDHYDDTFPPMTAEIHSDDFSKTVEEKYGIPCRALRRDEELVIE